ncbi:MAG: hypothetical protein OEZ06_04960 [Myxococcales bacterium]|nr:hypothetical protein [Myxococcales bacterium]
MSKRMVESNPLRGARLCIGYASGALLFCLALSAPAGAQQCDEDAGSCPADDDAGLGCDDAGAGTCGSQSMTTFTDGGVDAGVDAGDGGSADGGLDAGSEYAECSCETLIGRDEDRIHVCTESFDSRVCERLGCERGELAQAPCPRSDVRLCCEMQRDDVKTHLYHDCSHDNCELGFRIQCQDFGGIVLAGPCEAPERPDSDGTDPVSDDDRGFCAVAAPGAGRAGMGRAALALMLCACALALRRRRGP